MADLTRSDRQLMRQRGAGSRIMKNTDFGLKFGIQETREDRQLMRQRGAGNRTIGNVDFGFSFPTPAQSRRSSRTPRSSVRSRETSSKTPASNRGRSRKSAVQNVDQANTSHQGVSQTPQPKAQPEQANSSKRRRLNDETPGKKSTAIRVDNTPYSTSNEPISSMFPIAEDLDLNEVVTQAHLSERARDDSPLFFPEHDNKENDREKSYPESSPYSQVKLTPALTLSKRENELLPDEPQPMTVVRSIEDNDSSNDTEVDNDAEGTGHEQGKTKPKPVKSRKKRKSVVLKRKKRRSSQAQAEPIAPSDGVVPAQDLPETTSVAEEDPGNGSESAKEHENRTDVTQHSVPLWKKLAAKRAQHRRNRLSVSTSPAPHGRDDNEGDDTYVDDDWHPQATKKAPKKGARADKSRKRRSTSKSDTEPRGKVSRDSFPILTHRITNTGVLPTIEEEAEGDAGSGDDSEVLPATFSNRSQPNAVDVFAQICRETIQSTIDKIEDSSTENTSRAEVKQKRTALEAFGETLSQRLFDMSQAVESRMTLEARLRKSKREKADCQARWIEIRRQRDELALRADNIRRQNWESEQQARNNWALSDLAHNIEIETEKDESQDDDLEFMLRSVADSVSVSSGQGGILGRVRALNSQLERMATRLEGR